MASRRLSAKLQAPAVVVAGAFLLLQLGIFAGLTASAVATAVSTLPSSAENTFIIDDNDTPVITGAGSYRYRWRPDRLVLPPKVAANLRNGHGLARDKSGNIYFTYESFNKTDPAVRALMRFAPDGTGGELLGDEKLAQGVPHGIKPAVDNSDGQEYLYHANNAARIVKTTLNGSVVWDVDMTTVWSHDKSNWPFKPTDILLLPGTQTLYVADGYGLSKVHEFDAATGKYTGVVCGGKGTRDAPIAFNCDHGLSFDDRAGFMVISDRSNHRLRWITPNGTLVRDLNLTSSLPLPCNAQTSTGTKLAQQGLLLVPALGLDFVDPGPWLNGSVGILDKSNNLISNLEVARLLGTKLGATHPHDAIFLENGDIAVACWQGHEKGSKGGLTYWERLPPSTPTPAAISRTSTSVARKLDKIEAAKEIELEMEDGEKEEKEEEEDEEEQGEEEEAAANVTTSSYTNPTLLGLDTPDPGVLLWRSSSPSSFVYIATTTGGDSGGLFPLRTSPDLASWSTKPVNYIFPGAQMPAWVTPGNKDPWAPELHTEGFTDGRVRAYYVARHAKSGLLAVGAAVADTQNGTLPPSQWRFEGSAAPLVLNTSANMGNIDPSHYYDASTKQHWLLYKSDGNSDGRRTTLYAAPLSDDGMSVKGAPIVLLRNDPNTWEGGCIEAPWIAEHAGHLFLYYSGPGYCDKCGYSVGVARSSGGIQGPWVKHGDPILKPRQNGVFDSPGHCSVVPGVRGGVAIVYHAYRHSNSNSGRHLMLDGLVFNGTKGNMWPSLASGHSFPSEQSSPIP